MEVDKASSLLSEVGGTRPQTISILFLKENKRGMGQ
jgi:hypothetical protein